MKSRRISYHEASAAQVINKAMEEGTTPAGIADRIERIPNALTVRHLREIVNCSDQTIYRMIGDRSIPFFMLRGGYRFDPRKIAEWLRQRSMSDSL